MNKKPILWMIAIIILMVSACSPSAETTPTQELPDDTYTPTTEATPEPTATQSPTEPALSESPTTAVQKSCINAATFVADVTVPDNTPFKKGEAFVKTWRIRNDGTCTWGPDYSLAFSQGAQMNGPASTPLPVVAPGETTDISINLVAPPQDGVFTGYYKFHDPDGQVFNVGLSKNIWVKIIAGTPIIVQTIQPTTIAGSTRTPGPCTYTENAGYVNQLFSMINQARKAEGLPVYKINAKLSAAAMVHSQDMACNDFTGHTGSDGSWISDRIAAQGYSASFYVEVIFPSGTPQDAMDWWMSDGPHREAILSKKATEVGIGYVYVASSTYGGYYTVDFAAP